MSKLREMVNKIIKEEKLNEGNSFSIPGGAKGSKLLIQSYNNGLRINQSAVRHKLGAEIDGDRVSIFLTPEQAAFLKAKL